MTTTQVTLENRGGGYVCVYQSADDKQLKSERIEKFVSGKMGTSYRLIAVNNATDTRKVNPRIREVKPDNRVYTLVLESKLKRS
jgi:hypothetical protein